MTTRSAIQGARRLPGVSLLVVAIVLVLHGIRRATPLLAYEREAIAQGELWRWVTCHWVHATGELLFWDLVAFVPLATLSELKCRGRLVACLAISSLVIPAALFFLQPRLGFYGGLSGIDSALFALLATLLWRERRATGNSASALIVVAACAAFAAKIAYEWATGSGVFVDTVASNVNSSPLAHVAGAVAGVVVGAAPAGESPDLSMHRTAAGLRRNSSQASKKWQSSSTKPVGCPYPGWKGKPEMRTSFFRVVNVCCLFGALAGASVAEESEPGLSPGTAARLQKLKESTDTLSVVIHPVLVAGRPMQNVAEVLALMFEQGGLTDIDVSNMPFVPETDVDLGQLAAGYGAFVADQGIETGYALLGEYIGTPGKGVDEVRWVLVDEKGQIVCADSQTPSDADFRRIKPGCPMTCCLLLAERLRATLDLPEPDPDNVPRGRWAAHWDAASGLPSQEQRAAMTDRQKGLRGKLKSSEVTVLPALLEEGTDHEAAARLAESLEREGICRKARVAGERTFPLQPTPNEMKLLWELARGLRDSLQARPTGTPYTLCTQYFVSPRTGKAHGVHWLLCDAAGDWVVVDLQNNHHADFQKVDPASVDDCNDLVLRRIRYYLAASANPN